MSRPKGVNQTALLMAICNAGLWATIRPGRPPYSLRMLAAYTVVICIGYVFIWFYWRGKNWARIAVLVFSVLSILNLSTWNRVSASPALLTTPAHVLIVARAILGFILLYWLNTYPALGFFELGKKQKPPPGFR